MSAAPKPIRFDTLGDITRLLGVPARRIRANPPPGRATEKDLITLNERKDRLCELVDGVLVEKVVSYPESLLTCDLIRLLGNFLEENPLGLLSGPDGAMRLMPGLVRIPDVSFVSWEQLPTRERPTDPVAGLTPALAVEVLNTGNTKKEMDRKVRDYFLCGVRLVWLVALPSRTVRVYHAPDQSTTLGEDQTLTGGDVLPGFELSLRRLFAPVPVRTKGASRRPTRGRANGGRR